MPLSKLDPNFVAVAASDEITPITVGNAKVTWRMPRCSIIEARASLTAASTAGAPDIDIKKGGVSIFTTRITIDQNETTSQTAATPNVLDPAQVNVADDSEFRADVIGAGANATGLKVYLKVRWS